MQLHIVYCLLSKPAGLSLYYSFFLFFFLNINPDKAGQGLHLCDLWVILYFDSFGLLHVMRNKTW